MLIVEDESGVASMLADRLSFAGYRTATAEDGERALALERRPDVVLTDLYMPRTDGATLIKLLRDEGVSAPVIVMSAGLEAETAALRAHADGFLEKPFRMDEALSAIARAMGRDADD